MTQTASAARATTAGDAAGFGWDHTFTDTSWVGEAADDGDLHIETVTTLDATGAGSITEAFENAGGQPTVIVFEVGGVIELPDDEDLRLREPRTWVAGQTAPDPGITITKGMLRVHQSECIIEHISVMPGDETAEPSDGLVLDADDVLANHCTTMWGTDECAAIPSETARTGFANCVIAEGLYDSIHADGEHSRGLLISEAGTEAFVMGCLFAHNNKRHPLCRADILLANNFVYNFGDSLIHFNNPGEPDVTMVGLAIEAGQDSDADRPVHTYDAELYASDIRTAPSGRAVSDGNHDRLEDPPLVPDGLDMSADLVAASDVKAATMATAGARPAARPPVEAELIDERLTADHGLIDSQDDVGGYPDYGDAERGLAVPDDDRLAWLAEFRAAVE